MPFSVVGLQLPENIGVQSRLDPVGRKNPLVAPLIAFASGILIARAARFETPELAIAFSLLVALTLVAARWCPRILYAPLLAAVCAAGIWVNVLHRPRPTPQVDAGSQELVTMGGCVVDPPLFYEGRDQFTVELAAHARARASLVLHEGETPPDLNYGELVEFEGKLRPMRNFHNPGAFDFEEFSARKEIYWTAAVASGSPVKVLPGRCGSRFRAAIFAIRTTALRRIEALYPNDPYATGMMEATLIGEPASSIRCGRKTSAARALFMRWSSRECMSRCWRGRCCS